MAFVLVITIPIVLLSFVAYRTTSNSFEEMLVQSSLEQSALVSESIDNYMSIYGRAASLLSNDINVQMARSATSYRTGLFQSFEDFIKEYN